MSDPIMLAGWSGALFAIGLSCIFGSGPSYAATTVYSWWPLWAGVLLDVAGVVAISVALWLRRKAFAIIDSRRATEEDAGT